VEYQYFFNPQASNEYESTFKWYEGRSTVAADNLIIAVQNAIDNICNHPYSYRLTYKNLRETSLKKYPYNLIFKIDESKKVVIIISLYHHKRNPKNKYKGLG
jgi:plasmid stabilization system protein ParE